MEITIYHYALCVSLTLMIFFSYRFLFGRLPQKESYRPYRQSRMMMGAALLLLSANYMIHFFVTPRLTSPQLAIVINLCTYWGAVMLFGSALMMLLERSRITRKRIVCHAMAWAGYCVVAWMMWAIVPEGMFRRLMLFLLAAMFLVYASGVAGRVFHTFRKARRKLDDYYSEDSEAYIRWMSVFTYWAVVFGVAQGIFTFLPNRYVFIWIISAIPFYIYLYVSYANYFLFYERVEGALTTADYSAKPGAINTSPTPQGSQDCYEKEACSKVAAHPGISLQQEEMLEKRIKAWIERHGFAIGGLTIEDVARETGSNHTYISSLIGKQYGISFREWINGMRLEYAKELMKSNPDMPVGEVARRAGYLSMSYFSKTFKEAEGISPGKWNGMTRK